MMLIMSSHPSPELDVEYRELIVACLESGDPLGAHRWAKGWIGSGGGALLLDPWLTYIAAYLARRQPRNAVHAADLALGSWVDRDGDRAILCWIRAEIVRHWLKDPKTALADYVSAGESAPSWLRPRVEMDHAACEAEASASRKRKASVGAAPAHTASTTVAAPPNGEPPPDGQETVMFPFVDTLLITD